MDFDEILPHFFFFYEGFRDIYLIDFLIDLLDT